MQAEVILPQCYCWKQEKHLSEVLQGDKGLYRNAEFLSLHTIRLCYSLFFSCFHLSPRTCVYPSPQLQSACWHMRDRNLTNCCHQIQRHFGNLVSMFGAIPLWQAAHYHVRITNGFHLMGRGMCHSVAGTKLFFQKEIRIKYISAVHHLPSCGVVSVQWQVLDFMAFGRLAWRI